MAMDLIMLFLCLNLQISSRVTCLMDLISVMIYYRLLGMLLILIMIFYLEGNNLWWGLWWIMMEDLCNGWNEFLIIFILLCLIFKMGFIRLKLRHRLLLIFMDFLLFNRSNLMLMMLCLWLQGEHYWGILTMLVLW
jgi:hypothetical protein